MQGLNIIITPVRWEHFCWWRFIATANPIYELFQKKKQHWMLLRVCVVRFFSNKGLQIAALSVCWREKKDVQDSVNVWWKIIAHLKIASFAVPSRIVVRLITTEQEMGKSTFASEIRFRLFMESLRILMHVLRPLCCDGLHSNVEQRGISLKYKQEKREEEEENSIRVRLLCAFRQEKRVMQCHRRAEENLW